MSESQEILFEEMQGEAGDLGVITLNRPAALNSLNHEMITALHEKLKKWAVKSQIKAVVIRAAEGRAFCAGGDIRLVYERAKQNNPAMTEFFFEEYQLNRFIFHFPKPYIAFLDGITMGGGVGISIHGSHRVATDRILFAMPETGIGFFPDVGGTYFLPRLPDALGYYLGLTGARIKVDDCMALGLVTHKVMSAMFDEILADLRQTVFTGDAKQCVTNILARFRIEPGESTLFNARQEIKQCFTGPSIEKIMDRIQSSSHPLCVEALTALAKKSPTSLKVTLLALNEAKEMDFDQCMRQEFRLVSRFLLAHDFIEGIRALIIDKDQTPIWQPAELSAVSNEVVEEYFAPLTQELAE